MSELRPQDAEDGKPMQKVWVELSYPNQGHAQALVRARLRRVHRAEVCLCGLLTYCSDSGIPAALVGASLSTSHARMTSRPTR